MEWTIDYSKLKVGDVFELSGVQGLYTVRWVDYKDGGGVGMGEYPPSWTVYTDRGYFKYDPWCRHTYRSYRVTMSIGTDTTGEGRELKSVRTDAWIKENEEAEKRREQARRQKERERKLRQEALENMTPEQRAAFKAGM